MSGIQWINEVEDIARVVPQLLNTDFGQWERDDVKRLATEREGWELASNDLSEVHVLIDGVRVVFRSTLNMGKSLRSGTVTLLETKRHDPAPVELETLCDRLDGIGAPVRYRGANGPNLRWIAAGHTLLLQDGNSGVRLNLHPASRDTSPAAELAMLLHDNGCVTAADLASLLARNPEWAAEGEAEKTLSAPGFSDILLRGTEDGQWRCTAARIAESPGRDLRERRETFRVAWHEVTGRIGEPTIYGGSEPGPDARWRRQDRLLRLRGTYGAFWLEVSDVNETESDEHRMFEWGGAWGPDDPMHFDELPYLWQLHHDGPGLGQTHYDGGWVALTMSHLYEALISTFYSWIEQLDVQAPGWAAFTIRYRLGELYVSFYGDTLRVHVRYESGDLPTDEVMRSRGWHAPDEWGWYAEYPDAGGAEADAATKLIVAACEAAGVSQPHEELSQADVGCKTDGYFLLHGNGLSD